MSRFPRRQRVAHGDGAPHPRVPHAAAVHPRAVEEEPLRAELLSVSQLEQHAKSLAAWHQVDTRKGGPDRLLPRLAENEDVLREAYSARFAR